MMEKSPLCPERVRQLTGSFAFLEQRFVRDGLWTSLRHHAWWLSVFWVLVADRHGLSYSSFAKICTRLQLSLDDSLRARNARLKKNLMAFDGPLLQVLSLPSTPVLQLASPLRSAQHMAPADPATIRQIIRTALGADPDGPTHHL